MLAPMAGVTELPFRVLCRRMGCDLTFTEMVSAKGLQYQNARTQALLISAKEEQPCGVQLFGSEPAILSSVARELVERRAGEIALIDINMGCPAHKIVANGEGSALMKTPALAGNIIESVVKAVKLPVTVKFRKGWDEYNVNAVEFAKMAEQSGAAAVCVHGRTRAQQYSGRADWEIIAAVKAAVRIPVWGNGDVYSAEDALRLRKETGCDGVLVARGAQGNPFIFREITAALRGETCAPATVEERISLALIHARMQEAYRGAQGIIEMRKHIAWYLRGTKGAAALRARVNEVRSLPELETLLWEYKAICGIENK